MERDPLHRRSAVGISIMQVLDSDDMMTHPMSLSTSNPRDCGRL
jgi:hypothetical protein